MAEEAVQKAEKLLQMEENRLESVNLSKEQLRKISALPAEVVQEIRQQEDRLGALENQIKEMEWEAENLKNRVPFRTSHRVGLAGLGITGVALAAAGFLAHLPVPTEFAGGGLVLLAVILFYFFSRKQKRHARETATFLAEIEALRQEKKSVEEAHRAELAPLGARNWQELLEHRSQFDRYSRQLEDFERARQDWEAVEFQLLKYLGAIGIHKLSREVLDSVAEQFRSYFELAQQVSAQEQVLAAKQRELARVQDRLELTRETLLERLEEAGIEEKELEKAREAFEKLLSKRRQFDQLSREIEKRTSELTGLFSGKSEAELRQQQEELRRKQTALLGNHPEL